MPEHGWDRRTWRGPGGWGRGRRPPWWPEDEPWPPEGPDGWRHLRRRFMVRVAAFVLVALSVLLLLATLAVWAVGSLLGPGAQSVIATILVVLVIALLGRFIVGGVRGSALPIADMMTAASRVEAGDYGARVREEGPREMRRLARAFNAMSARLASDEAERRQLLADVSHELRTPLSVIQGNVEGILDGLYPADREHLEPILDETRLLERLVDDLRTLSLSASGALQLQREPTDLAELLTEIVAGFEPRARGAELELRLETAGALRLDLDQSRLRQVIGNLLENAMRFTPAGGTVTVGARSSSDGVELVVRNTGPGIPPDALLRVFDRFYRSPESRGSGLGLPIARSLVEAHGGTITAESTPGEGTTIRITLPADGRERRKPLTAEIV